MANDVVNHSRRGYKAWSFSWFSNHLLSASTQTPVSGAVGCSLHLPQELLHGHFFLSHTTSPLFVFLFGYFDCWLNIS